MVYSHGASGPSILTAMQSLLSASETNAFQSFLSIMDYSDDSLTQSEWAMLSAAPPPPPHTDAFFNDNVPLNPEHKEALSRATKDLMSLEPDRWNPPQYDASGRQTTMGQQQRMPDMPPHQPYPRHLSMNDVRPAQSSSSPTHGPSQPMSMHLSHSADSLLGPPLRRMSTSQSSPIPSTSSSSLHHALQSGSGSTSSSSTTLPSPLNHNPAPKPTERTSSSSSKRARASQSPPLGPGGPSSTASAMAIPKQTLLSPSQKKANHIQSEQKRRANIRRGYEALCETVPALREAIRLEEDEAMGAERGGGTRRRKKKKEEKDRMDGRAGPRSENVVLIKTIEHIQGMLSDRSILLARLHAARSMLPPGHPVLLPPPPPLGHQPGIQTDLHLNPTPPYTIPLWEREWKGGDGKLGDEDGGSGSEAEDGTD